MAIQGLTIGAAPARTGDDSVVARLLPPIGLDPASMGERRPTIGRSSLSLAAFLALAFFTSLPGTTMARPPIRKAFFNVYPGATGSRLDDLPSNPGHCGVCHFDFKGGGPRNPYGLSIEVAIPSYSTYEEAVLSVENQDPDYDGFSSLTEITDTVNFGNTPTFPGLSSGNVSQAINVDLADITPHLTPSGGTDTIPPDVTLLSPNGGESFGAGTEQPLTWTASDASGVVGVDILMSDDNGATYKFVAKGEPNDGTFTWFVPNRPGSQTLIRVSARDGAGNYGSYTSEAPFTITGTPGGLVPHHASRLRPIGNAAPRRSHPRRSGRGLHYLSRELRPRR